MSPELNSRGETGTHNNGVARAATALYPCPQLDQSVERTRFLHKRRVAKSVYDFIGAPLRMIALPDEWSTRVGFTSLEDERLRMVLPVISGRVLDIGAGNNRLVDLYGNGVGVEVHDWGGGAQVVEDTRDLPFEDGSFDTVTFVACLNHIPYRDEVLVEAKRVLKPGGRVVITMIGHLIGKVGHAIWWYSEDKHRELAEGELMGMTPKFVTDLLAEAGYTNLIHQRFLYQMNHLFVATRP